VNDETKPDAPDLEKLLETLRHRVEQRRRDGSYPPGLEASLDVHFRQLTGTSEPAIAYTVDELNDAVADLADLRFGRSEIVTDSNLPGGSQLHRAIGKGVGRQIDGVIDQTRDYAVRVNRAVTLMAEATRLLSDAYDSQVLQQLDDLQVRLAEAHRTLNAQVAKVDEIGARMPGIAVDAWYSPDAFTAHFRGVTDDMAGRYADLAELFVGCDPVLDIGFGRGEFLELLRDLGVEASGIEYEQVLVDLARERGLRAETGKAVEYLSGIDDDSLGGVVMIQVIEHLSPQHVLDVVKLLGEKVRRGGRVVVETVNPTSLYTYAHAFWVDPDHVRPVHPTFLGFLFAEAGFASVERVDRSPVPSDETLELLPGDDETAKRVNANFERINALLFGAQDYAIVATR
jgi:2-polyprenyl-3-methyl-5-hydroxy-6-metoxy-1,4-benzoquinol methylase